MHLVFYTHNVLETYGFSTLVSVGLLIGAGYGFASFLRDAVKAIRHYEVRRD